MVGKDFHDSGCLVAVGGGERKEGQEWDLVAGVRWGRSWGRSWCRGKGSGRGKWKGQR